MFYCLVSLVRLISCILYIWLIKSFLSFQKNCISLFFKQLISKMKLMRIPHACPNTLWCSISNRTRRLQYLCWMKESPLNSPFRNMVEETLYTNTLMRLLALFMDFTHQRYNMCGSLCESKYVCEKKKSRDTK